MEWLNNPNKYRVTIYTWYTMMGVDTESITREFETVEQARAFVDAYDKPFWVASLAIRTWEGWGANEVRAVLEIELIGDDFFYHQRRGLFDKDFKSWHRLAKRFGYDKSNSWVAKITGLDSKYGFKREFLKPTRDYSQANSTGSRGIFAYYVLKPGLYEINHRQSWRRTRRYFARVEGTEIIEIDREEVFKCLESES